MAKLSINNKEIEVPDGITVLQACELADVEIPRFCYHARLSIAGNCRMCLVEIEGGPPKPAASCAMPIAEGMRVRTDTPMVKEARQGAMEFLLANHPLDCPICDQGGECDLQDQAMAYGKAFSEFGEQKRSVKDKNLGPLIKTHMTRCIHCTRCVRFMTEVAGVEELGAINRGEAMEIVSDLEKSLSSELSGNIIDLCPVGALTSKPYAFRARSWELKKTESIDVLDAVGSAIRVDSRGRQVMRILPRLNEDINEEWLSDKARFSCDGLARQRLDRPYIKVDGRLTPVSWQEAYRFAGEKLRSLKGNEIAALAGDLAACEEIFALKKFMESLGVANTESRLDGAKLSANDRSSYIFNTTIAKIEESDLCLLIGANPRKEAPILNARIRKAHINSGLEICSIGCSEDLTYPYEDLGGSLAVLDKILKGDHAICKRLKRAKKPIIIIGMEAIARKDGAAVFEACKRIAGQYNISGADLGGSWKGFNVLHKAASRVGALDLNFVPKDENSDISTILKDCKSGKIKALYLLGADEIDTTALAETFVIYQGSHGDKGAHAADVIFPAPTYTEKDATYVNTEGRVQRTVRAVFAPDEVKEDWLIINEFANIMGVNLGMGSAQALAKKLHEAAPHLAKIDQIKPVLQISSSGAKISLKNKAKSASGIDSSHSLNAGQENYYMTNPISRNSTVMAQCSKEFGAKSSIVHFKT